MIWTELQEYSLDRLQRTIHTLLIGILRLIERINYLRSVEMHCGLFIFKNNQDEYH